MIEYRLNMGDVVTSPRQARYACFGLGSCIGVFIQDRSRGLTGAAHVLLPGKEQGPDNIKFYNVITAVDEILSQFRLQGSCLTSLRAKITGGANVININSNMGARNTESIIGYLTKNIIYIAAVDVGGKQSRTAKFESATGDLMVKISGEHQTKIY